MKGILGRKIGMTQVFTTDGVLIPVNCCLKLTEKRSITKENSCN